MAIKKGDKVRVHYTGKLADGSVFDSSRERDPFEFTVGAGEVIPGFEEAVVDLEPGSKATVFIPADKAYGAADDDLVFAVSREQVPDHIPLKPGTQLQLANDKTQMDVVITEVGPEEITLDANHPLAGKDLEFEIEVLDVKAPE